MSHVDSATDQERTRCPLCGHQLKKPLNCGIDGFYPVECEVCGMYGIEKIVFLARTLIDLPPDQKPLLSAIIRRDYQFTGRPKKITLEDCKELASQAPGTNDVPGKVRYLLGYIARKTTFPGERVRLNSNTDYPICFAASADEFRYYARHITDAGFVDKQGDMSGECHCCLTPKGGQEVERIPTLESPYAFVAMSFSKEGSHGALLTQAFEEAIKPAIEDDAGYQEAIRVDRKQFLGDIVFEIIARIKECRFLVADATEHKNGVYFEAGYAMGMGLPVIWMCHKDDLGDAHFDTSHLNHIVWDDVAELRKNLANRILATIGQGPRRTQTRLFGPSPTS